MKRKLIFVGLKIAELAAIVFFPYWIGLLSNIWFNEVSVIDYWFRGVLSLTGITVVVAVLWLDVWFLISFGKTNWKWAGKIARYFS